VVRNSRRFRGRGGFWRGDGYFVVDYLLSRGGFMDRQGILVTRGPHQGVPRGGLPDDGLGGIRTTLAARCDFHSREISARGKLSSQQGLG
jgi:hypothetical protein